MMINSHTHGTAEQNTKGLGPFVQRLWARWRAGEPLAPEGPFYAIGDIHGCAALLCDLLAQLETDLPVVCVGDYIDRGPDSAGVLRLLHAQMQASPRITCLMGNHEAMLLRFLEDPVRHAAWLRYGGRETLESFGPVPQDLPLNDPRKIAPKDLEALRDHLRAVMGPELLAWLQELPAWWQSGNVVVTHAGADPRGPIATQDARHMIWGHPDFRRLRRADGLWVVHGHVIQPAPSTQGGRISIDTGAFATGRLTAARIAPGAVDFIESIL